MVHLKNIIKGILAGAVFFMAVQVGVAQERATASIDKTKVSESAESKESVEPKVLTSDWYFIGTTSAEVLQPNAWQATQPSTQCDEEITFTLPCHLITDEPLADTDELMDYLEDRYDNDVGDIAADAETRKQEL